MRDRKQLERNLEAVIGCKAATDGEKAAARQALLGLRTELKPRKKRSGGTFVWHFAGDERGTALCGAKLARSDFDDISNRDRATNWKWVRNTPFADQCCPICVATAAGNVPALATAAVPAIELKEVPA